VKKPFKFRCYNIYRNLAYSIENCNYKIPGYNLHFSTYKRNQNDGIVVFIKENLIVEMYEYRYLVANFLKLKLLINDTEL